MILFIFCQLMRNKQDFIMQNLSSISNYLYNIIGTKDFRLFILVIFSLFTVFVFHYLLSKWRSLLFFNVNGEQATLVAFYLVINMSDFTLMTNKITLSKRTLISLTSRLVCRFFPYVLSYSAPYFSRNMKNIASRVSSLISISKLQLKALILPLC